MKRLSLPAFVLATAVSIALVHGDDKKKSARSQLDAATSKIGGKTYSLKYKFKKGQKLRWKVTHIASSETTIKGNTQKAQSSSVSTKVWTVAAVFTNGMIKLIHSVDDVEMWQKVSDRKELKYNSKTDKSPPPIYAAVAETIGVPMFELTLNPQGQVIKRVAKFRQTAKSQIGLEQVTLPMPKVPVKVGQSWNAPSDVKVRLEDERVKTVKTRRLYTLKSVKDDVATIRVKTEVLTPIHDPKVKLHLLQRLNSGTVRFDIKAGQIVSKEMEWDETIVNFNGPASQMRYLARFKEEFITGHRVAAKPAGPAVGP